MNKIYSLNLSMDQLADLIQAARESENVEYIEPEMTPGSPVFGTFAGTFRGQAQYVHITSAARGGDGFLAFFEGDPKLADILDVDGPIRSIQQLVEYFAAVDGNATFAKVLGVLVEDESFQTYSVIDKNAHEMEDDTVAHTAAVKVLSVNLANMTLLGRYIAAEYLREITELKSIQPEDLANCKLWVWLYDCTKEQLLKLNKIRDADRDGQYTEEYVREHHPSAAAAYDADAVKSNPPAPANPPVPRHWYFIGGLVVGAGAAVGLLKIFGRK